MARHGRLDRAACLSSASVALAIFEF
jgi:hypothetical protein